MRWPASYDFFASLMLTTECMVSESAKDDAPMGGGMGGMGM
jgi:chaperonin GroEL